ncbi:MAG: hypothetical protein M1819_003501 [Sarea resinae]|nr:MAG: hypothetical protein M1819_003501 [Sarea resinae]
MDGAGQNASSFKHSRSTSRKISTDYGLSRRHDSLQLRRSMSGRDEILEIPSSPPPAADAEGKAPKQTPVTWLSLPRKGQLALLFLSRLFDFLQVASLQAYMFYQLKSFDETLPDSKISWQAGVLQGSFTAAQFATAILWGRVADARWGGRKRVLLIGLVGTGLSCIGLGFSRTFAQAVIFRTFGGAINGTVGIM